MASLTLEDSAVPCASHLRRVPALQRVQVEETTTSVALTGTVPSFYMKQLAQETVLPLLNGRKLVNRLVVVRD